MIQLCLSMDSSPNGSDSSDSSESAKNHHGQNTKEQATGSKTKSVNETAGSLKIDMEQPKDVDINSKLDLFLARQRSCNLEQQHQQLAAASATSSSSLPAAPQTAPVAMGKFNFWRDMMTISESPTPETLRTLMANSGFCYQSIAGDNLPSQPCPAVALNLNNPGQSTESKSDSMRMSDKNPADNGKRNTEPTSTAAPNPNPTRNPAANTIPFAATGRDMFVEFIVQFSFYLPILFLLFIKVVHDYKEPVLDVTLLLFLFVILNRSLPLQVARLTDRQVGVLLRDFGVGLFVVVLRLYMATAPPEPFGLILPPSELNETLIQFTLEDTDVTRMVHKPMTLKVLLYHALVSDLMLKLITVLVKIMITMLPLQDMKFRARFFALLEYTFQIYRCLTPITLWLKYIYGSYPDGQFIADVLKWLYIAIKFIEFIVRLGFLMRAFGNFRSKNDSIRSPTQAELDAAADSACPICNDPYTAPIILECRHIFCDQCVRTWFKREPTCPMCRAKVSDDPKWQDGSTTTSCQIY